MDSLLANYASSDEDNDDNHQTLNPPNSLFGSVPPPSKGAAFTAIDPSPQPSKPKGSIFSALPPPSGGRISAAPAIRSGSVGNGEKEAKGAFFAGGDSSSDGSKPKGSIFSALPAPKPKNPKKVVEFRPPIDPSVLKRGDFDEDDDEDEEKKRKIDQISTAAASGSRFSSFLPAPKNSLGLGASLGSGSSRISVGEANLPADNTGGFPVERENRSLGTYVHNGGDWVGAPTEAAVDVAAGSELYATGDASGYYSSGAEAANFSEYDSNGTEASGWDPNYAGYVDYGSHAGTLAYDSVPATIPEVVPNMGRIGGKRERSEIPAEIVEVNQDELMKNRPRQDQAKMTGIAFGPSYQAASSAKGKPSKLHKRKHQIGSLFFDMKQKEMELAERRSKGLLTKAQTQGKYGW